MAIKMKKCDYCAKEITYFEQYCDENCEKKALDFYTMRDKFTKVFSIINVICVFAIPVGIFLSTMRPRLGYLVGTIALTLLGLTVFALPFPVENMISSMKIKKAVKVTRIFGAVCFIVGLILVMLSFLIFSK